MGFRARQQPSVIGIKIVAPIKLLLTMSQLGHYHPYQDKF